MKYTVVLTKDEDGNYIATVPALQGCHTWGRTRRQAIKNAMEVIEGYVEMLENEGEPIPKDAESLVVEV